MASSRIPSSIALALVVAVTGCRGPTDSSTGDQTRAQSARPGAAERKAGPARARSRKPTWDQSRPTAPSRDGLGVAVGTTALDQIKAHTAALGMNCRDASPATLVKQLKQARKAKMEAKLRAEGKSTDAISSASWNRQTAHERVTQIRWSCQDIKSNMLTDMSRPTSSGRVLFVLDSPGHAVRHVSYSRRHQSSRAALEDILTTSAGYHKRFGPPHVATGDLPDQAAESFEFARMEPIVREWQYGDLRIKVDAFTVTGQTVRIYEMVEVPAGIDMAPLADRAQANPGSVARPAASPAQATGAPGRGPASASAR